MKQPTPPKSVVTTPRLTKKDEFEAALADYHVSAAGQAILKETPFVVIVGPTSGGRNTVINLMLKTGHYYFIVSDTTRPPRQNNGVWEQEGVQYFFRKEADMLKDIQQGLFLEAEIIHSQQVSGVSIREIKKAHDAGKIAITDVEIEGGINVATLKPDATAIYLVPPSFKEWLRRIHGRTAVTKEELRNRLEGAIKGFRLALANPQCFTFVVNVDKDETANIIDGVARLGKNHDAAQEEARQLVRTIWDQAEAYLNQM